MNYLKTLLKKREKEKSDVYPVEWFNIQKGNIQTFKDAVNKSIKNKLVYPMPSFFTITGPCEKSNFKLMDQTFGKKCRVFLLASENMDKLTKIFFLKKAPDIILIDTDPYETESLSTLNRLYGIFSGAVVILTQTYDGLPKFITDHIVYSLELGPEPSVVKLHQINKVLKGSAQEEINLDQYNTIVNSIGTDKLELILAEIRKERLQSDFKINRDNLIIPSKNKILRCFSEKDYRNKYETLLADENPLQEAYRKEIVFIHSKLSQQLSYITVDEKSIKMVEKQISEEHTNIENPEDLLSIIKVALLDHDKKLSMPPLLFVGPPGCGKTRLASIIAKSFGQVTPILISCGTGLGVSKIVGSTSDYKSATYGVLLESIWTSIPGRCCLNPILIFDEIDKMPYDNINDVNQNLYATLLSILEPETANQYADNFFEIPINNFICNYILTANDTQNIPEALLSRMNIIKFRDYTEDELVSQIIPSKYQEFSAEHDLVPSKLNTDEYKLIAKIASNNTRMIKLGITKYIAQKQLADVNCSLSDIEKHLMKEQQNKTKQIGFHL